MNVICTKASLITAATAVMGMALTAGAQQAATAAGESSVVASDHIAPVASPLNKSLLMPRTRAFVGPNFHVPIGTCTSYSTGFDAGYTVGAIDGQNGWTVFEAAGPDFPTVSDANPAGGTQHMRNVRNTGVGAGASNGGFSPICSPGGTNLVVDVYITNSGGADYHIAAQNTDAGFIAAYMVLDWQLNMLVMDNVGGVAEFVNTGIPWTPGVYTTVEFDIDQNAGTVDYYYDGALVHSGTVFGSDLIDQVVLFSDNFHLEGEFGDFDNLEVTGSGAPCPADLDGNSIVGVGDLLVLLQAWGPCPGCVPDFDGNDNVGVGDMLILLQAWGACPPGSDYTGACCFGDGSCDQMSSGDCATAGGTYNGDATNCASFECPQPALGQSCDLALEVDIDGAPVTGNSVGNTGPGFPICGDQIPGDGVVWFVIDGTGTEVTAATCGSSMDAINMAVYCANCDSPICVAGSTEDFACPDPFSAAATWCAGAGETYYVAAWGELAEGDITLTVTSGGSCTPTVFCSPENDECVDAIDVTANIDGAAVNGINVGASTSALPAGSPSCHWAGTPETVHSMVWYSFVASDPEMTISSCDSAGSLIDTTIAVYSGTCGSLVEVACGEDECGAPGYFSTLAYNNFVVNDTYYIMVGNPGGWTGEAPGTFSFTITTGAPAPPSCAGACGGQSPDGCWCDESCATFGDCCADVCDECPALSHCNIVPPDNDLCVDAIDITANINGASVNGNNVGAGISDLPVGSPSCQWQAIPTNAHNAVWYSFVAPASGSVTIDVCDTPTPDPPGSGFADSLISLFSGSCGALVEVSCNDDGCQGDLWPYNSSLTIGGLTPDATYYIAISNNGGWASSMAGDFILNISSP